MSLLSGSPDASLPGWELVSAGLRDRAAGRVTIEGLLVETASIRLAQVGVPIGPRTTADAEARLYDLVVETVGEARAHGRYNALRRRLASYLRAASRARPG